MNSQPLSGLKVLVTRPRDQAADLARAITDAGGVALLFPLLDITPIADTHALHQRLARLAQFDMAIFISPNAVKYGMAEIAAAGGELPRQVATIGQSSARALQKLGIDNIIAPTERFDSEGLLALPELADMARKKVMILRGDGGRELLGDTLKTRGASVKYAACYQRGKTRLGLADLLRERPDVITVTSSEALTHLYEMQAQTPALLNTPLFVPHSRIAEFAEQQGWANIFATTSGDDGLLTSLIAWRNARGTI